MRSRISGALQYLFWAVLIGGVLWLWFSHLSQDATSPLARDQIRWDLSAEDHIYPRDDGSWFAVDGDDYRVDHRVKTGETVPVSLREMFGDGTLTGPWPGAALVTVTGDAAPVDARVQVWACAPVPGSGAGGDWTQRPCVMPDGTPMGDSRYRVEIHVPPGTTGTASASPDGPSGTVVASAVGAVPEDGDWTMDSVEPLAQLYPGSGVFLESFTAHSQSEVRVFDHIDYAFARADGARDTVGHRYSLAGPNLDFPGADAVSVVQDAAPDGSGARVETWRHGDGLHWWESGDRDAYRIVVHVPPGSVIRASAS